MKVSEFIEILRRMTAEEKKEVLRRIDELLREPGSGESHHAFQDSAQGAE